MNAATYELAFDGRILKRGFWLYVWEISTTQKAQFYYVGRTGDSSTSNAQSPFNRMGHHLGFNAKSNVLRRRLETKGVDPETCAFRLVTHGPILEEAASHVEHLQRRDRIGAMEKALADAMTAAGYNVINKIDCRAELDAKLFAVVLNAFAVHFSRMDRGTT